MDTNELLTLGGATIIVTIVVEIVKRALNLGEAAATRFGPLLSVTVGIVAVVAAAATTGGLDIANAVLTGLLAGSAASGVYSFASKTAKT